MIVNPVIFITILRESSKNYRKKYRTGDPSESCPFCALARLRVNYLGDKLQGLVRSLLLRTLFSLAC